MGFAHNPKRHEANGREAVKKVDGKIGWSENLQRRTQKQRETERNRDGLSLKLNG